jgi:hypothetical protein
MRGFLTNPNNASGFAAILAEMLISFCCAFPDQSVPNRAPWSGLIGLLTKHFAGSSSNKRPDAASEEYRDGTQR